MTPPRNWILSCNSLCKKMDSCSICEDAFPGFQSDYSGTVHISDWAIRQHSDQIDQMITKCPHGCIELTELLN